MLQQLGQGHIEARNQELISGLLCEWQAREPSAVASQGACQQEAGWEVEMGLELWNQMWTSQAMSPLLCQILTPSSPHTPNLTEGRLRISCVFVAGRCWSPHLGAPWNSLKTLCGTWISGVLYTWDSQPGLHRVSVVCHQSLEGLPFGCETMWKFLSDPANSEVLANGGVRSVDLAGECLCGFPGKVADSIRPLVISV